MFTFNRRLNGSQALVRLAKLEAIWALLELVSSYFECINEWPAWQYIHFVISIPLFVYMASVVVNRMNDVGWSRNFGFGSAGVLFLMNAFMLIFAQHSLLILVLVAVVWIAAAGALFALPSEIDVNEFGSVPDEKLNVPILLIVFAATAAFTTGGFSIECNSPAPLDLPLPHTPIPQPSVYRSCWSCCDAKGYFINCGCQQMGNGYQCFGG